MISLKKDAKSYFQGIYAILGEEFSNGKTNLEVARELLDSGIKIIQYREKDKKAIYKYEECLELRKLTAEYGCMFIVNDDIDIAILVGADGVHTGQEDLPIAEVKKLVGDDMIVGRSTHSPSQAIKAIEDGADYIGVGPIFATKTKKDVCDPVGLEYLEYVAENHDIPFVAIGGIKEHNLKEVVGRGARCACLVTDIVGSRDIPGKIESLNSIFKANQNKRSD